MKIAIDMAYKSLIHYGEELCGDKVELVDREDSRILVLADGMGSGVRANILATLTAKIISTLMYNGLSLEEVVDTVVKTLPMSSVNGMAYSTFSIIQVFHSGYAYIAEYENPECVFCRNGRIERLPFIEREIEGKVIRECVISTQEDDTFLALSDGCVYCGTDQVLNYAWNWDAVAEYCADSVKKMRSAAQVAERVKRMCEELYGGRSSDDATIAVVRLERDKAVNIMTGPALDRADDHRMVREFMEEEGVRIVCGGITSQVVARELGKKLSTSVTNLDPEIPPTSRIEGIDLVTEGVLTLNRAIELLEEYQRDVTVEFFEELSRENGATRLVCYLIEDCTTVNLYVGRAVNKDYTTKELPFEISVRRNLVKRLEAVLKAMHRNVVVHYY